MEVLEKSDSLVTHRGLLKEKPHLEKTAHNPETLDIELDKGFGWVSLLWKVMYFLCGDKEQIDNW